MIINELVRRLDSKGRTIGDILREDINIKGIYLGASNDKNSDPIPESLISKSFIFMQSITPEWLGKKINMNFVDMIKMMKSASKSKSSDSTKPPPFFEELKGTGLGQKFIDAYNSPDFTKAEISSVNFRANARGIAKLASIMANEGQGLLTQEAWKEMHGEPKFSNVTIGHFNFTKGGVNYFENSTNATDVDKNLFNKNREGYFGWYGYGGSIMQWHPEFKIGFAFIPTFLNITEVCNMRGAVLQKIVKDCAKNEKEE